MPTSTDHVTVVGSGAMGSLCAILLAEGGVRVSLWGRSADRVADLNRERENKRYLRGHLLPSEISIVHEPERAFDNPLLIVSAVPTQYMRDVWSRLQPFAPPNIPIVSVAKGIENKTLLRPTEVVEDCLGANPVAVLSGPSIAAEVACHKPASLVVASRNREVAECVQALFSSKYLRVYTSDDLVGVEVAAAAKNVIALAAGICDGMDLGDNAKASLLTRGLVEIARLGVALGAAAETFRGLAGVGDLVTTCVSKIGRNRTAGERIGRGETVEEILTSTQSVVEGISTTKSILALAEQNNVEMPIAAAMSAILFAGRPVGEVIDQLMTRQLGSE